MVKVGSLYKLDDKLIRVNLTLLKSMQDRIVEVIKIIDKKVYYSYLKQDTIYDLGLDMFEIFFKELTPTEVVLYA